MPIAAKCTLTVNGQRLKVRAGDTLVNAGLAARMAIPHDCCAGQCTTCKVQVVAGAIDDQGTADGSTVLACQATIEGDAEILFDEVPLPCKRQGRVASIRFLSPEIVEVVVELNSPFVYLPGQYVKVSFAGFPARDYSPTAFLDGHLDEQRLVFHVKRYENGAISSALGDAIGLGHRVTIAGPYGHAFYRPGPSRLVLVASGTGFAPIWPVARAARLAEPRRDMTVIAAARDPRNLYMQEAVNWLAGSGVRDTIQTATGEKGEGIHFGRPTQFLPELGPSDVVYAAGLPAMVDAVKEAAELAGAECHAHPFTINTRSASMLDRLRHMMRTSAGGPALQAPPRPAGAQHVPVLAGAGRRPGPTDRSSPAPPGRLLVEAARPPLRPKSSELASISRAGHRNRAVLLDDPAGLIRGHELQEAPRLLGERRSRLAPRSPN